MSEESRENQNGAGIENTNRENKRIASLVHSFFIYKNVVFPAQAEYSYFSADFRLKIFLYSLKIISYDISVLEFIGVSMSSVILMSCQ